MDLLDQLVESSNRKGPRAGKFSLASLGFHGVLVGFVVFMSTTSSHRIDAQTRPIRVYLENGTGAPPPPPPPPPPAASSSASTPKPFVKPVEVPKQTFIQPSETPRDLPEIQPQSNASVADLTPSQPAQPSGGEDGGVPGGVAGGVAGGVQGGVVGGTIGGTPGGQIGGVPGGTAGGEAGSEAKPPDSPPPSKPEGPVRVGGDVKAPVIIKRVEPKYDELARKAHISGVVIVEAVIDKEGNVDKVTVVKGLPMGLTEAAEEAVKHWKFRPGTLNGEPVDVIFNLTVNFTLN